MDPQSPQTTPPPPEQSASQKAQLRRLAARATAIGIQFSVSIGLGWWLGHWAEQRWDFAPWGGLVGLLLGAAAAFRDLYLLAKLSTKANADERQTPSEG
jgi:F0F1-type ATP synthase assembly protein I